MPENTPFRTLDAVASRDRLLLAFAELEMYGVAARDAVDAEPGRTRAVVGVFAESPSSSQKRLPLRRCHGLCEETGTGARRQIAWGGRRRPAAPLRTAPPTPRRAASR